MTETSRDSLPSAALLIEENAQLRQLLLAAQQKNDLQFNQTPLAVIEWDMDFRVTRWNPAAEHIFGYSATEALGQSAVFIVPKVAHPFVAIVMQELLDGRGGGRSTNANLTKHGAIIQCEWYNSSLRNIHGQVVGVTSLVDDITARTVAEDAKNRLQAQLQQVQKMESLGSLASGIAHDMNNVLGAILGLASAHVELEIPGSPSHKAFETITKAATRGGKMVKGLLSFARQSPAEDQEIDVNSLLREEISLLERTALFKMRLVMELASDLLPIRGDAGALAHAFMNLCVNAADAMPNQGELFFSSRNINAHWIEITVKDTGTGMSKEVLDKALDPFFTTKKQGKGTGLGLSLVYGTVKAHKGEIELQSAPGRGTTVIMRFPTCSVEPTVGVAPADMEATPAPSNLHILLIDDDELIQNILKSLLQALGHQATTAWNGESALAKLSAGARPDMIILDLNMPGIGGAETLSRIRTLLPTVPVLLATGRADQSALNLVSAHPFVTLLAKPFGLKDLELSIEKIFSASR